MVHVEEIVGVLEVREGVRRAAVRTQVLAVFVLVGIPAHVHRGGEYCLVLSISLIHSGT